jgi:hypothetical protein
MYATITKTGERLLTEALNALGIKDKQTTSEESTPVVINTLPWPRSEIIPIKDDMISTQKSVGKNFVVGKAGGFTSEIIDPEFDLNTLPHAHATCSSPARPD